MIVRMFTRAMQVRLLYKTSWDFALNIMDFVLKIMDFVQNIIDFVLNLLDFPLKMMQDSDTWKDGRATVSARIYSCPV